MEITVKDINAIPKAAASFIKAIGSHSIFAFDAEMGAGKTTFISEVCRQLGASDDSASPTFAILNEYQDANGKPLYHFDFYRLDSPEEALDMGAEDYFYSGYPCFIEWPDRLGNLLPEEAVVVKIRINPDNSRTISW